MKSNENERNYHMFKCSFPGCNEIIPVKSYISSTIPSTGFSYMQKEGVELSQDLIAIDVPCPYCSRTNHFQMKDMVKPINRKEYDELSHSVKSKKSLMHVINKVLQSS